MKATPNHTHGTQVIGARSRTEVERSLDSLHGTVGSHQTQTQFYRGMESGLLWALGRAESAPITGARGAREPGMGAITAEVDAATVQLENQTLRTVARDYVQGAHDALVWICGYSNDQP
ncbi:hypothetical protein GXW83_16445 [Streptacidiphilus sp. PB12-B1b]|uniref:hypothetical protein n=1 Tax=Streptacidiphilus sp. PB12-B1b TaxID=2705012 RepID=UPI0015FA2172|nr:hypothetical protein [Streptacidiphilus sp. PB12-B1b]QMU77058.1 hypothetical protein GXW83_16445 [Streptacidiphilus sp. PB12-B1b]